MSVWTIEHGDGLAFVRFTRPPLNMMSFRAIADLRVVLETIARDAAVRIVVLVSGVAGYFVAHADHDDMGRLARGEPADGDSADWARTLAFIAAMPQPVVAAIDGQAWGGGCELALACSFRLASPRAHFAQMEIVHGVIPGAGGTQRLPRLIGAGRAARMIMTGTSVDAGLALAYGLVDAILPGDGFEGHVRAWTAPIVARSAPAVFAAKRAIFEGLALPFTAGLALERALFDTLDHRPPGA